MLQVTSTPDFWASPWSGLTLGTGAQGGVPSGTRLLADALVKTGGCLTITLVWVAWGPDGCVLFPTWLFASWPLGLSSVRL